MNKVSCPMLKRSSSRRDEAGRYHGPLLGVQVTMNAILKTALASAIIVICLSGAHAATEGASDSSTSSGSGVVAKTERAVARGAKAAASGIQRGAKATARGVKRGAKATEGAAHRVAGKVSKPASAPAKGK
jgi:hypothetical protein